MISADNANTYMLTIQSQMLNTACWRWAEPMVWLIWACLLVPCTVLPVLPGAHSAVTHQFQTHLSGDWEKIPSTYFPTLLFSFKLKLRWTKSKCCRTVSHCTMLIRREVVSCLWFNENKTKLENHHSAINEVSLKLCILQHWLPSHVKCILRKKSPCCFMPRWSCLICSLIHSTSLASFLKRLSNGSLNNGTWFYQIRLANWCCSQKTN